VRAWLVEEEVGVAEPALVACSAVRAGQPADAVPAEAGSAQEGSADALHSASERSVDVPRWAEERLVGVLHLVEEPPVAAPRWGEERWAAARL